MSTAIYPTVTLKVNLPGMEFADDDERLRFQDAVQATAEFYEKVISPKENMALLVAFTNSVLIVHELDPDIWADNLWNAVSSALLQLYGRTVHAPGHA